ncbi:hypothetical protein [Herbaspirillum huttiense]|uniref:hypothetical protein n=1 Tax=Herbaspirillum huttiense TaxID=863372 RepID=UPI0031CDCC54
MSQSNKLPILASHREAIDVALQNVIHEYARQEAAAIGPYWKALWISEKTRAECALRWVRDQTEMA